MALATAMLLGASWSDLRTRRVPNLYWFPFAAFAAVLAAGDLAAPLDGALLAYGVAGALAGLFYLFWRLRLFGGADAKGLMVLAFLAPWPLSDDGLLPPALDAVVNGSLAVLGVAFLLAAANLARGRLAFPAMFLGFPMALAQARRVHVWPLQDVAPDGRVRWRLWQRVGDGMEPVFERLAAAGVARPWVTPKLPLMVFLLLGLWVSWGFGNLALRAVAAGLPAP